MCTGGAVDRDPARCSIEKTQPPLGYSAPCRKCCCTYAIPALDRRAARMLGLWCPCGDPGLTGEVGLPGPPFPRLGGHARRSRPCRMLRMFRAVSGSVSSRAERYGQSAAELDRTTSASTPEVASGCGVLAPRSCGTGAECGRAEEKHEPVSDIDTAVVDSLKTLDPKRPIREADIRTAWCQEKSFAASETAFGLIDRAGGEPL